MDEINPKNSVEHQIVQC